MKTVFRILLLILIVLLLRSSLYTVAENEFVYVTVLGEHVATYDGSNSSEAGLHFGWPWPIQTVVRVDRAIHHFVLPPVEQITKDRQAEGIIDQTVTIDGYVCWRVPNKEAVDQFIRSVGTVDRAEKILLDRIRGDLNVVIPTMSLDDLVNTNATIVNEQREILRRKLLEPYQSDSTKDGIEVIDIRIRRLNHPPEVRYSKLQRIISEREKKAASYRAEGLRQAANIRSESDAQIRRLQATVQAEIQEKRGIAEAEAERILNQAQSKDPAYYAELRKRQIALNGFKDKTKVWSTQLWELLFPFPSDELKKMSKPTEPGK